MNDVAPQDALSMLCEPLTSTTTVLEHNVTTANATAFKLAVQGSMARLIVAVARGVNCSPMGAASWLVVAV